MSIVLIENIIKESSFEDMVIDRVDGQRVEFVGKSFYECTFCNCNFSNAIFEECVFVDCEFIGCNLTMIKIPYCKLDKTSFDHCKMIGINWTVAAWRTQTVKKKSLFTVSFKGCALNFSIFIEMNIVGAMFIDCTLNEVAFDGADLQGADFKGSDLVGAIFNDTYLAKADFSKAKNYAIDVTKNTITKAKFSFPEAESLVYALDITII